MDVLDAQVAELAVVVLRSLHALAADKVEHGVDERAAVDDVAVGVAGGQQRVCGEDGADEVLISRATPPTHATLRLRGAREARAGCFVEVRENWEAAFAAELGGERQCFI